MDLSNVWLKSSQSQTLPNLNHLQRRGTPRATRMHFFLIEWQSGTLVQYSGFPDKTGIFKCHLVEEFEQIHEIWMIFYNGPQWGIFFGSKIAKIKNIEF